ncbi:hypothetical protein M3J09_008357 [Ascochyta lentis]
MSTPQISPKTIPVDLNIEMSPKTRRADSAGHVANNFQPQSKTDYDFTKLEDVRNYLRERRTEDREFELQLLSGGTANYVYRLTETSGERRGHTEIFKHAAEHLASNPAYILDPERMDYEARILHELSEEEMCYCTIANGFATPEITNTHVHTVRPGFYERDSKLLNLEDGGNINLKNAYFELSAEDVQEVGRELGKWLASLHGKTPTSHVSSTIPGRGNNKTAIKICRYSYRNLPAVLSEYGHDAELGHKINKYFGRLITKDEECVCHGDFWPGNILLRSGVSGRGPHVLTVVDWEMVRIGNSATDVGQFAAEAFLLDRFHGNKGLHAAFIRAYFETSAVSYGDKERIYPWMTRVAIHFAVHIAFWPTRSVHWANGEDTKALVNLGVAVLQDAISSLPNAMVWRVFEGLPGLDVIAQELMEKRGGPYKDAHSPQF